MLAAVTKKVDFLAPPRVGLTLKTLDREAIKKLHTLLRAQYPNVRLTYGRNDEGDEYAHLGSPEGSIDLFIQCDEQTGWESFSAGLFVFPTTSGASVGLVVTGLIKFLMRHWAGLVAKAASLI